MREEGKTLVELMIAVAIIGIVSSLSSPSLSDLHVRVQTRSVTEEIASELRLARQLAMTHRDRVRVVFDLEREALESQFVDSATTHHVFTYSNRGVFIAEPSAGPEIVFHPSGRSATATTISLRNSQGEVQQVTVSITGRVSIL